MTYKHLIHSQLQWAGHWRYGMATKFYPTLYYACDQSSIHDGFNESLSVKLPPGNTRSYQNQGYFSIKWFAYILQYYRNCHGIGYEITILLDKPLALTQEARITYFNAGVYANGMTSHFQIISTTQGNNSKNYRSNAIYGFVVLQLCTLQSRMGEIS